MLNAMVGMAGMGSSAESSRATQAVRLAHQEIMAKYGQEGIYKILKMVRAKDHKAFTEFVEKNLR